MSLKKSTSTSSSSAAAKSTTTTSKVKKEKQKEAEKEEEEEEEQSAAGAAAGVEGEEDEHENEDEEEAESEEERGGGGGRREEGGTATILEEVAVLWGMVKDRPFAESKFTQLALDRYVFCRELPSLTEERMDGGVQRMVLLLREAAHIAPQMACHRILVTYKRKMSQALRRDREGYWLQDPVYKNSEAGRLVGLAAGVVLRLCEEGDYGAYFVELVLDELLQQLYKSAKGEVVVDGGKEGGEGEEEEKEEEEEEVEEGDEKKKEGKEDDEEKSKEGEGSSSGGQRRGRETRTEVDHEKEREKEFAFRRQRDGFAAAALFTCLCKELGLLQRVRALVYDIFLLNGKLAPLGPLAAFFHLWPAVLGGKEGVMARAMLVCFHEAYKHQRDAVKTGSSSSSSSKKVLSPPSSSSPPAAVVPMNLAAPGPTDAAGAGAGAAGAASAAGAGVDGETEAKAWVAEMAYEGFARYVMGRGRKGKDADDVGVEAPEVLAEELKTKLLQLDEQGEEEEDEEEREEGKKEAEAEEVVRALVLLASVQSLQWVETNVLQEYATGELSTPPGMMRLLAGLAREVTFRDAIERKEGGMLRRLLLCFSEVLAAEDPHPEWQEEDQQQQQQEKEAREQRRRYQLTRLWASKGLADLPGVNVGELKPVISWIQSLPTEARDAFLPPHLLRTVVYNQQRPHCCAIVRSSSSSSTSSSLPSSTSIEQQAELELQGILHDLSLRVASGAVLGQMTHNTLKVAGGGGKRGGGEEEEGGEEGGGSGDVKRAAWTAEGGWEHLEIWHMYSNNRMDELDYPNKKPSEIVILEGDVVGSPLLGAELRSLLLELRFRPYPWDVLALSFALPSSDQKTRHRFKVGTHASALPKEAFVSRRGYVLTHTGAAKLTRVWQQYESVEECLMGEAAAGRIVLLAPGDGRPVIHMSPQDQFRATLRSNMQMSSYQHRGGRGTGGGRGGGHGGGGEGRSFGGGGGGGGYPLQERQDPPSPGWTPSV